MKIEGFDFQPGRIIASKYEIESRLGIGWQGEVYLIREIATGIDKAAKIFFPHRNPKDRVSREFARKLFRFRHIPEVIQYYNQETLRFQNQNVTCLISDFVDGEMLSEFVKRHPGKRLHYYMALRIIHKLASIVEQIHAIGDYHGDLHTDNVFIQQRGVHFQLKLIDPFDWQDSRRLNIQKDTVDITQILHELVGGAKHYVNQPKIVKSICCGLKTSYVTRKFRTAKKLREFLDVAEWE